MTTTDSRVLTTHELPIVLRDAIELVYRQIPDAVVVPQRGDGPATGPWVGADIYRPRWSSGSHRVRFYDTDGTVKIAVLDRNGVLLAEAMFRRMPASIIVPAIVAWLH